MHDFSNVSKIIYLCGECICPLILAHSNLWFSGQLIVRKINQDGVSIKQGEIRPLRLVLGHT